LTKFWTSLETSSSDEELLGSVANIYKDQAALIQWINTSSFVDNMSTITFSVAHIVSPKLRQMRARLFSNAIRYS